MQHLDLFNGFAWPLPKAFSDALARCKFECGDVLYNHEYAYTLPWGEATTHLSYSIQIKSPSRANVSSSSAESVGMFKDNWTSDVEFELISYKSFEKKIIRTCQGNLYKMLRDGDLSLIDSRKPLPIPMTSTEMNSELENLMFEKSCISQFLLPFDETSEILKGKRKKIENAIGHKKLVKSYPACGLKEFRGRDILPTLEVVVFDSEMKKDELEAIIKDAVYVPLKNKKTNRERFRLRDHGLLR